MGDTEKTQATTGDICIGRVLHEDDKFITLEVIKDEKRHLRLEDGDKFLSLLFVHQVDGKVAVWKPWEANND